MGDFVKIQTTWPREVSGHYYTRTDFRDQQEDGAVQVGIWREASPSSKSAVVSCTSSDLSLLTDLLFKVLQCRWIEPNARAAKETAKGMVDGTHGKEAGDA